MALIDRLTASTQHARTMDSLAAAQNRMARVQEQVSSGKAFQRVSDAPSAARSAMTLRSEQGRVAQYIKNIDHGMLMLNAARINVDSVNDQMLRVRDLLVQGQQSTATASVRSALAEQVEVLRSSLLINANAQFGGRPVFGGTTSGTTAYDASTGAYLGNTTAVEVRVDAASTVRTELNGPQVFGNVPDDVFTLLRDIATNLRAGPVDQAALAANLTALDARMQQVGDAQAIIGSKINQLSALKDVTSDREVSLTGALSSVEDTDLAKAIMELTLLQTGYEASLRATASVMTVSLMDFLR